MPALVPSIFMIQIGSIVRTIHRLDETCGEVRNAARMIGDAALYAKMELAGQAIKRDIVFAASLVSVCFCDISWIPIWTTV